MADISDSEVEKLTLDHLRHTDTDKKEAPKVSSPQPNKNPELESFENLFKDIPIEFGPEGKIEKTFTPKRKVSK